MPLPTLGRGIFRVLDAGTGLIRPLKLDGVVAQLLCFPGTNVANLAVVLIVPTLAGDGIGDGFAQFMGTGGCERIKGCQASQTALTIGIGHCSIEDLTVDVIVITTEGLARA